MTTDLEPSFLKCFPDFMFIQVIWQVGNVSTVRWSVWYSLIINTRTKSSSWSSGQDNSGTSGSFISLIFHLISPVACHSHGGSVGGTRGPVSTTTIISKEFSQIQGLTLLFAAFLA